MENMEISIRIEGSGDISRDEVSDAIDAMADSLGVQILWNYVEPEGITGKPIRATVELEADRQREIIDELHEIARRIQDGYETGAGWKYRDRRKGA